MSPDVPDGRPRKERETRLALRAGGGLGLAPAARGRLTGHRPGAVVAEVGLLPHPARVRIGHAHDCAFCLVDFLAALVTYKNRFACHEGNPSQKAAGI